MQSDLLGIFVIIPAAVVIVAVLIAWHFIEEDKPIIGYIGGLVPITLMWLILVGMVANACASCHSEPMCCEWTGVGIAIYTMIAFICLVVFLIVTTSLFMAHKSIASAPTTTTTTITPTDTPPVLAVALACACVGGLLAWLGVDFTSSGFVTAWHNVGSPPGGGKITRLLAADPYLAHVETENAQLYTARLYGCIIITNVDHCWHTGAEGDLWSHDFRDCTIRLTVAAPPTEVVQRIDTVYCSTQSTRQTNYALALDGQLWVWHQEKTAEIYPLSYQGLWIIGGVLLGFIIGAYLSTRPRQTHRP